MTDMMSGVDNAEDSKLATGLDSLDEQLVAQPQSSALMIVNLLAGSVCRSVPQPSAHTGTKPVAPGWEMLDDDGLLLPPEYGKASYMEVGHVGSRPLRFRTGLWSGDFSQRSAGLSESALFRSFSISASSSAPSRTANDDRYSHSSSTATPARVPYVRW
jgi:hypothetical protein